MIEILAPHPQLAPLLKLWLDPKVAGPVDQWMRDNADLLEAFVRSPVTHESLSALPFARIPVELLRQSLVRCDVLPPLDLDYAGFVQKVHQEASDLSAADRRLLIEYFRFEVVPVMRWRASHGERVDRGFCGPLTRLRSVVALSQRLQEVGVTLRTMNQEQFAAYVASVTGLSKTVQIGIFMRWLNRSRAPRERLSLPRGGRGAAARKPTEDAMLCSWVGRALTDESFSVISRLVIIFGALYGQMLSTICRIHRSQLGPRFTTIRFGDVWLKLPDPLPDLVRRQYANRPRRDPENLWLFASSFLAGRPASVCAVRMALPVKLKWRDLRATAMLMLVRQIEAPMLARMLGISLASAIRWAGLCASPSWDQMLRMHRDVQGITLSAVTIADRVAAEYGGMELPKEVLKAEPSPALARKKISDEEFESFRYERISRVLK